VTEQLNRIASELTELQNAVARLIATSRDHDGQLQSLQRRLGELAAQSRDGAGSVPPGFAPSPRPPAAAPAPSVRASAVAELYQAGLAKVRAGDYDAAVLILYDLVANHPGDPLRESAQLLIADIYYRQKDFRGAVAEVEGLLAAVPNGSRTPDALLKLGLSLRGLGDEPRARQTWERIVKEYPTSAAAREARVLLRGARPS
jgi:tol-pal system protein YbgF